MWQSLMSALKVIKLMYQIKAERANPLYTYLFILKVSKSTFMTLDLIKSSAEIRNTKVTIKCSIIMDGSPFKMVNKKKNMTTSCFRTET